MSIYLVVNSTIDNPELLDEYVRDAGATLGIVPVKVLAVDTETKAIEGEAAGPRTVILEFESEDDFRTWYDSPQYRAIIDRAFFPYRESELPVVHDRVRSPRQRALRRAARRRVRRCVGAGHDPNAVRSLPPVARRRSARTRGTTFPWGLCP